MWTRTNVLVKIRGCSISVRQQPCVIIFCMRHLLFQLTVTARAGRRESGHLSSSHNSVYGLSVVCGKFASCSVSVFFSAKGKINNYYPVSLVYWEVKLILTKCLRVLVWKVLCTLMLWFTLLFAFWAADVKTESGNLDLQIPWKMQLSSPWRKVPWPPFSQLSSLELRSANGVQVSGLAVLWPALLGADIHGLCSPLCHIYPKA